MPPRARELAPVARRQWFYSVRGYGQFPLDMLRYDRCWPASEGSDVPAISASLDQERLAERTVCLVGLNEPTEGRWLSFGWQVL